MKFEQFTVYWIVCISKFVLIMDLQFKTQMQIVRYTFKMF